MNLEEGNWIKIKKKKKKKVLWKSRYSRGLVILNLWLCCGQVSLVLPIRKGSQTSSSLSQQTAEKYDDTPSMTGGINIHVTFIKSR